MTMAGRHEIFHENVTQTGSGYDRHVGERKPEIGLDPTQRLEAES